MTRIDLTVAEPDKNATDKEGLFAMDELKDIVFRRVDGIDYTIIKNDIRMFNIFLSVDGKRSVKTIAQDEDYDQDYLFARIDDLERMGLLTAIDGACRQDTLTPFVARFCGLPKEYLTGIDAVDNQHQRLVNMVTHLDDVRKTFYPTMKQKQKAVGEVVSEMIDYTISHFAFEESLMEDAKYNFFKAHKRIHELFIKRAGEYKERWSSGEDIIDELYDVLHRWLFNHIQNDDKAFAPTVIKRLKEMDRASSGWLVRFLRHFFN